MNIIVKGRYNEATFRVHDEDYMYVFYYRYFDQVLSTKIYYYGIVICDTLGLQLQSYF